MKKKISILLCIMMMLSMLPIAAQAAAGTYEGTGIGLGGAFPVSVTVDDAGIITDITVGDNQETPGIGDWAIEAVPAAIIENQSLEVDAVTGVTLTSRGIINGVADALSAAGLNPDDYRVEVPSEPVEDVELSADVIIVGGGGAGCAAAVSATDRGASVILIEKTGFLGGNSVVAGGIYNVAYPELQDYWESFSGVESLIEAAIAEEPVNEEHAALIETVAAEFEEYKQSDKTLFDSPSWHALQTWNGGDKVADLGMVQIMTNNALDGLKWLEDMGMEFQDKVTQGAGALYQRTVQAVMPNGTGYFDAFIGNLADKENFTLMMDTTGESLIMDGETVVGVNAVGRDGNAVTLMANKGVILATGGFAGNVELRQEYCEGEKWPDLGTGLNTSNVPGVTGDGIFMARDAGAALVNMEQIQLLHVCNPYTGATGDLAIPMDATGYLFINKEGERFVREDGRRDEISKAIIEQTDNMMYLLQSAEVITNPDEIKTLGGNTVTFMLENNLSEYVVADTLEEMAEILGVPADALANSVAEYNAHVDSQEADEFGRALFSLKFENGPWYAYPRKPAAHHTMGGVDINEQTQALREDGSAIEGLYCAGEITGVLHGGNRLGGNAIVDFVVFGRIAGESAAAAS